MFSLGCLHPVLYRFYIHILVNAAEGLALPVEQNGS